MFTFKASCVLLLHAAVTIIATQLVVSLTSAHAQTCNLSSGTFAILHGMPDGGGAEPVQDCAPPHTPIISFTFKGVVPDDPDSNECNEHDPPTDLDVWISRTGTGEPDSCGSCSQAINLWHWNGSQWINNDPYIDADGNGTFSMGLVSITDCQGPTCLWIFIGKRESSSTCAQLSNDCFNSGSVDWTRTCP